MNRTFTPLSHYVDMLRNNQQFRFLRFGDGEFLCYLGEKKSIGKGEHFVFPEVTEDIRHIVQNLNPDHYNGLQGLATRMEKFSGIIPDHPWHDSDVFHKASEKGQLFPFIEALKYRRVVLVSRADKRKIRVKYDGFIQVRDSDCYHDKEMVLEKMKCYPAGTVFLFAASRLSVPAIYHSHRDDCTMIDIGSLFDPYVGIQSRAYHSRLTDEIMTRNLTGQ